MILLIDNYDSFSYNLYQLLNHLNLFGPTYLGPVLSIVAEYIG